MVIYSGGYGAQTNVCGKKRQEEEIESKSGMLDDRSKHVVERADEKRQQTSKSCVCRSRSLLIIRAQSLCYTNKSSVSTARPVSI